MKILSRRITVTMAILAAAVSASFGAKNRGLASIGLVPLNDLGPASASSCKLTAGRVLLE